MIQIKILNLRFSSSSSNFFKGLEMSMERGKLHSLAGKNGAGKSTLFSILRGDLSSSVIVDGEICFGDIKYCLSGNGASATVLQKAVGLVPQRFDTLIADQFSFKDNLRFANLERYPSLFRRLGPDPDLPPFLKRFGIPENTPAKLLSGGQRQILALMMAAQKKRDLLLLDEPTATLDPVNARMVFEFISELISERQLPALVICHDRDLVAEFRTGTAFELHTEPCGLRRLDAIEEIESDRSCEKAK